MTQNRKGVDYIGVSASFIVHDGNGRVLLQKRGSKSRDEQGVWDTGGGGIEFGETIEEALRRELREELCCEAIDMYFVTVADVHRVLDDGTKTHWISITYAVQVNPMEVRIGEPGKTAEIGWFNLQNLPTPVHSQFNRSIATAKKFKLIV